jgi:hypothetical protein
VNRADVPGTPEVVRIRAPRRLTAIRFGCLLLVAVVWAALHLHPATRSDTPAPTEEVEYPSGDSALRLIREWWADRRG